MVLRTLSKHLRIQTEVYKTEDCPLVSIHTEARTPPPPLGGGVRKVLLSAQACASARVTASGSSKIAPNQRKLSSVRSLARIMRSQDRATGGEQHRIPKHNSWGEFLRTPKSCGVGKI